MFEMESAESTEADLKEFNSVVKKATELRIQQLLNYLGNDDVDDTGPMSDAAIRTIYSIARLLATTVFPVAFVEPWLYALGLAAAIRQVLRSEEWQSTDSASVTPQQIEKILSPLELLATTMTLQDAEVSMSTAHLPDRLGARGACRDAYCLGYEVVHCVLDNIPSERFLPPVSTDASYTFPDLFNRLLMLPNGDRDLFPDPTAFDVMVHVVGSPLFLSVPNLFGHLDVEQKEKCFADVAHFYVYNTKMKIWLEGVGKPPPTFESDQETYMILTHRVASWNEGRFCLQQYNVSLESEGDQESVFKCPPMSSSEATDVEVKIVKTLASLSSAEMDSAFNHYQSVDDDHLHKLASEVEREAVEKLFTLTAKNYAYNTLAGSSPTTLRKQLINLRDFTNYEQGRSFYSCDDDLTMDELGTETILEVLNGLISKDQPAGSLRESRAIDRHINDLQKANIKQYATDDSIPDSDDAVSRCGMEERLEDPDAAVDTPETSDCLSSDNETESEECRTPTAAHSNCESMLTSNDGSSEGKAMKSLDEISSDYSIDRTDEELSSASGRHSDATYSPSAAEDQSESNSDSGSGASSPEWSAGWSICNESPRRMPKNQKPKSKIKQEKDKPKRETFYDTANSNKVDKTVQRYTNVMLNPKEKQRAIHISNSEDKKYATTKTCVTKVISHQSGVKGVCYDTSRANWIVEFGTAHRKQFSCSRYGYDEALRLAIELRKKWESELSLKLKPAQRQSGVVGVTFNKGNETWDAMWNCNGVRHAERFSIKTYGYDEALRLAIAHRKEAEKNYNFVLK